MPTYLFVMHNVTEKCFVCTFLEFRIVSVCDVIQLEANSVH